MVQVAPIATVFPQLSYSVNDTAVPANGGCSEIDRRSGALPLFVRVTLWGALEAPTGVVKAGKLILVALSCTPGRVEPGANFARKTAGPVPEAKVPGVGEKIVAWPAT